MVVALKMWISLCICIFPCLHWNTDSSESFCFRTRSLMYFYDLEIKVDVECEGLLVRFTNYVQIWMSFVLFFFDKESFLLKRTVLVENHFLKTILWSCGSNVWVWIYIPPVIYVYVPYIVTRRPSSILWWTACFTAVRSVSFLLPFFLNK